jgi:protein-tyrosine kinase
MSHIYEALEKAEKERNKQTMGSHEKGKQSNDQEVISLPSKEFDVPSFPLFQTGSLAAEQFRKLRTFLIKMHPMKTIMVTSALQGEGKTFVSANLAVGIAVNLNLHALLIECDLRNPSLGEHFGQTNGKGLSDFLSGKETIPNLINHTKLERLNIISGGSIPVNPAELVGSNRMEAMVEEIKNRYDDRYIIFDTTPILATSEPEILTKLVDGIILVVLAGSTPRETIKQAISIIGKEKLLGVILNQVEFKSSGLFKKYFGSNGYYHSYGNGSGRKKG